MTSSPQGRPVSIWRAASARRTEKTCTGSCGGRAEPTPQPRGDVDMPRLFLFVALQADARRCPRSRSTSASLVTGPTRGATRRQAVSVSVRRVSATRCAMFSDPDEIVSRAPALTRTGGASRCQVGTRREGRLATARGR
jgi:hypothetical protein